VRPDGGLFLWATLPEALDTSDLLPRCLAANVAFVPGRAAFLDNEGANALRLNYSAVDEDALREGARRIGAACEEQLALVEALAPARREAPREP
jgi:2-aminoadipate transaminase